ncbi:hypothetical protein D5272_16580 [bacterium D16-76]|nr:hypothetical protein [bacterium D16-76]
MTDQILARRTGIEIAVDGVNITKHIRQYLLGLKYTDCEEGEADDLQLTLQDREGVWAGGWLDGMIKAAASAKGLKLKAALVQRQWKGKGDHWLDIGIFDLDSVEASGPPAVVVLKASALPFSGAVRQTKKTRSWEHYSLHGIAKEIAVNNGMGCAIYAAANPSYDRAEQRRQTDIEFLSKLCKDAAASLKVTNNTLVLFDQREYEKQLPITTIRRGKGGYLSYRFSATSAGTQYDSCRVSYTDPAVGKVIEGIAKSEDYDEEAKNHKQLEITARAQSPGEAQALAENHLRLHNKFAKTARFSFPGDAGMVAGVTVMLEGWASFDGKYLISRAVHTVNASGYTTDIELRKVL